VRLRSRGRATCIQKADASLRKAFQLPPPIMTGLPEHDQMHELHSTSPSSLRIPSDPALGRVNTITCSLRLTMNQVATPTRSQAGTSSVPPSRPTSPPTISKASAGPAGAPGRNDEHRRARREQLRTFYGLKDGAGTGAAGPSTPKEGDVLDIDSGAFDAGAYYEDLIQKSSLAELMKKAVALNAGEMGSERSCASIRS
jgi:hypothetical protein